ncbi:hypothetical protein JI739_09720 [Ramlibacter sp. AW1]|uniref:DUF2218 domain-containing protein n=1 Tax=Ramlibacter aurantiacus TaxID=2801330 RepID=A0A937D3D9_9BURK|nr:hypothetical protein [Ramlibacter aurantiacus]MBL0420620.1 hypothetical protein [Ramlibacter aurantiacus]
MRTLVSAYPESVYTSVAKLARSVIDAPAGPEGVPCVYAEIEHVDGRAALVARTCDESQTTLLLLPETDPQRLQAALDYLTERLTAIGLTVVKDERELEPQDLVH